MSAADVIIITEIWNASTSGATVFSAGIGILFRRDEFADSGRRQIHHFGSSIDRATQRTTRVLRFLCLCVASVSRLETGEQNRLLEPDTDVRTRATGDGGQESGARRVPAHHRDLLSTSQGNDSQVYHGRHGLIIIIIIVGASFVQRDVSSQM